MVVLHVPDFMGDNRLYLLFIKDLEQNRTYQNVSESFDKTDNPRSDQPAIEQIPQQDVSVCEVISAAKVLQPGAEISGGNGLAAP